MFNLISKGRTSMSRQIIVSNFFTNISPPLLLTNFESWLTICVLRPTCRTVQHYGRWRWAIIANLRLQYLPAIISVSSCIFEKQRSTTGLVQQSTSLCASDNAFQKLRNFQIFWMTCNGLLKPNLQFQMIYQSFLDNLTLRDKCSDKEWQKPTFFDKPITSNSMHVV